MDANFDDLVERPACLKTHGLWKHWSFAICHSSFFKTPSHKSGTPEAVSSHTKKHTTTSRAWIDKSQSQSAPINPGHQWWAYTDQATSGRNSTAL